ncbi:hypothetical protein BJV78DRAFT_1287615 [Lactifluus subvellereus]|nr:hypothetical protein BJV78DRAFT_1287615 [Lactifluus subvellereus]
MNIWTLLVKPDFQAVGRPFMVEVESSDSVLAVKWEVKQQFANTLALDIPMLIVWKTDGEMILNESKGWDEKLKNININDRKTIWKVREGSQVAALGLSDDQILLVQIQILPDSHQVTAISDEALVVEVEVEVEVEDEVSELKEYKRYKNTLDALGKSPSQGAKLAQYRKSQGNLDTTIYDGRRGNVSTSAPPIQLFHPIFDSFTHYVNDPNFHVTIEDFKNVYDLMYFLSGVRGEKSYGDGVRQQLGRILGVPVHKDQNPDSTRPDGIITLASGIPYVFIELKREMGEGGCDSTSQVSLSMRRSWIHETRKALHEQCCCPTFLVAAGGAWLTVMGSVFTDKFIVQRLTDARVFITLRKCLAGLQEYYDGLKSPPLLRDKPHPHFFPHITSFPTGDTHHTTTHFQYLKSLEDDPTCVTYLAEITGHGQGDTTPPATEGGDKVVVKFVASYGLEVHKFLARQGWAPTLRYYGPLQETGLSNDFPEPARCVLPGLHLPSPMDIVVMDYIYSQSPLENALSQIEKVLAALHTQGYVFGDLQQPNILFNTGGVKFIDFNWSGRYDEKICDEDLADGQQKQNIIMNMGRVQVRDRHYAYYPESMSMIEDMWAPGMKPLTLI